MRPTKPASKAALVAVAVLVSVAAGYAITRTPPATRHTPARPGALAVGAPNDVAAYERHVRPEPTRVVLPRDRVAPAPPTAFEIAGAAFDIKADVCQMDYVRPLDPPGDQVHTVCWVRSQFGVAPGNSSGGTSYILGHSWSQQKLVFNPLSELATKQIDEKHPQVHNGVATYQVKALNGYRITLRTRNGILTYVVRSAFGVRKARAADVRSLMANSPGRVVLITCAVGGGADLDYNIVVYGYLISSVAARPAP